jgi:hypothetical protein
VSGRFVGLPLRVPDNPRRAALHVRVPLSVADGLLPEVGQARLVGAAATPRQRDGVGAARPCRSCSARLFVLGLGGVFAPI